MIIRFVVDIYAASYKSSCVVVMAVIYIGSDHGGFELKRELKWYLEMQGYRVIDVGAHKFDAGDDYPDYAKALCKEVIAHKAVGILACKSGQGMSIAANKVKGIRAVIASDVRGAKLAKQHVNANVLCIGSDLTRAEDAERIAAAWAKEEFSGEERHERRLGKIARIEEGY